MFHSEFDQICRDLNPETSSVSRQDGSFYRLEKSSKMAENMKLRKNMVGTKLSKIMEAAPMPLSNRCLLQGPLMELLGSHTSI